MNELRSYKQFLKDSYLLDRVAEIEKYIILNNTEVKQIIKDNNILFHEICGLLTIDKQELLYKYENEITLKQARITGLLLEQIYKEVKENGKEN